MTYVYKCLECGHTFEIKQSIKDYDKTTLCPECNSGTRRVIKPAIIIYKTGGFYSTDSH